MEATELLSAKKLVSATLITIGVSVQVTNSSYYQTKFSFTPDVFKFLSKRFGDRSQLRSNASGHAACGMILLLTEQGGRTVSEQSKTTITTTASCDDLSITKNKVALSPTRAIMAEYEDGSRYLLVEPLPEQFFSSKVREDIKRKKPKPAKAIREAFAFVGQPLPNGEHVDEPPPQPVAEPVAATPEPKPEPVAEEPTPAVALPTVLTGRAAPMAALSTFGTTKDLRDLITLFNEQVDQMREVGMSINLRVDDLGHVRAGVQVVFIEEL